jgi:hypothetical protein
MLVGKEVVDTKTSFAKYEIVCLEQQRGLAANKTPGLAKARANRTVTWFLTFT